MNIPDPPLKPETKNIIHRYDDTQSINQDDDPSGCITTCKLYNGKGYISERGSDQRQEWK